MSVTLVLGGARSGKTRFALAQAERRSGDLVMIATAQALDDEMAERIAHHRAERGPRWRTVEEPLGLAAALHALRPGETAVVDCLTLWLSNLLLGGHDIAAASGDLLTALDGRAEIILIANEVGFGIVPENALARRFRDEAGRLNQQIAERADIVVLVVAGVPLTIKGAM